MPLGAASESRVRNVEHALGHKDCDSLASEHRKATFFIGIFEGVEDQTPASVAFDRSRSGIHELLPETAHASVVSVFPLSKHGLIQRKVHCAARDEFQQRNPLPRSVERCDLSRWVTPPPINTHEQLDLIVGNGDSRKAWEDNTAADRCHYTPRT